MLVSILCINSSVAVKDLRSEDKDKVLYIDPPRAVAYLGGGALRLAPPLVWENFFRRFITNKLKIYELMLC